MAEPNEDNGHNRRSPWFVPIVVSVISFLSAVVSNIDRLVPGVQELGLTGAARKVSAISGEWHGIFREYDPARGEVVTYDTVHLQERGSAIEAKLGTPADGEVRAWDASGIFKGSILALTYWSTDPERRSVGTIVVEGRPVEGTPLKGYWLGYDRDRGQLVTCPYILTKRVDTEQVRKENSRWLDQACYRMGTERNHSSN